MINPSRIFELQSEAEFHSLAVEVARFQLKNCAIYRDFARLMKVEEVNTLADIPFLPIRFFKEVEVVSTPIPADSLVFLSSGTGEQGRSKHIVTDPSLYQQSYSLGFEQYFGNPKDWVILALLPNYLEQGNSGLVNMVEGLITQSSHPLSGFVLNEMEHLHARYRAALASGGKCMLFGVSYALLDLAEQGHDFSQAVVVETGGMKGRRQELTKPELHEALKQGLNTTEIHSEYGMTELLSQGYCGPDLIFKTPAWMRVVLRDVSDPKARVPEGQRGAINIIDLANLNSCSFIANDDLGKLVPGGFLLEGRVNHADIRGCNQMVG
ncbi:MAG: acyl transferase [Flavobacteriales bacterium]